LRNAVVRGASVLNDPDDADYRVRATNFFINYISMESLARLRSLGLNERSALSVQKSLVANILGIYRQTFPAEHAVVVPRMAPALSQADVERQIGNLFGFEQSTRKLLKEFEKSQQR